MAAKVSQPGRRSAVYACDVIREPPDEGNRRPSSRPSEDLLRKPPRGVEPLRAGSKPAALPLSYGGGVRTEGVEPPWPRPAASEAAASTCFATSAWEPRRPRLRVPRHAA